MERIEDLIHKLTVQHTAGESAGQLLKTIQLLQAEVLKTQPSLPALSKSVAVVLPAGFFPTVEKMEKPVEEVVPETEENTPSVEAAMADSEASVPEKEEPTPLETYSLRKPVIEHFAQTEPKVTADKPKDFYVVEEVPTLRQALPVKKELNESLSQNQESLNDRLKQEKTELGHSLKSEPIKDLRKGIGVNDKFLFINELFRGDDAMYERSIKTINAFHILPEAEYWINRELKVKLGWTDTKDTVQHFYEVVRRRFS